MHKLMEYTCDQLEEMERKIAKGGKLSMQDLQVADTLAHLKKNLLKSDEMSGESEYSGRGYSRRMSYDDGGSYRDGGSYDSEERYMRPDGSYSRRARSRDSMGRYSGEGSIDEKTKEELYKMIEKM